MNTHDIIQKSYYIYIRLNKIEITVLRPARIRFEGAALQILLHFQ